MRYSANLLLEILGVFSVLFLLLLGIFAIEKLAYLVDLSMTYQANFTRFVKLYLSILPRDIDNIIPVAILTAAYIILLRKRETREFVVLSGAGISVWYLTRLLMAVAIIVSIFCLLVSGFVKPYANFSFRSQYYLAVKELLAGGLPSGKFFNQADKVLYVASNNSTDDKKIRLFGFEEGRLDQIFLSDCARMNVVGREVLSNVCSGKMYLFNNQDLGVLAGSQKIDPEKKCRVCADESNAINVSELDISRSAFPFEMASVFREVRRHGSAEQNLRDLLSVSESGFSSRSAASAGARKVLLGISCLFAIAIAIAAVALTNARTRLIALPLAIGIQMTLVVAFLSGALFSAAIFTPLGFVLFHLGFALLGFGAIALSASLFYRELIVPALVRS